MKVVISGFMLVGFIAIELNGVTSEELINGCALDVLVGLMNPLSFALITIIPIIMVNQYITERDRKYQFVLRCGSWLSILRMQLIKILFVSLLMTVLFLMAAISFSYKQKLPLYNWNSFNSLFFIRTDQRLELQGFTVYCYAFICMMVRMIIIQNIILIFKWGCQRKIMGVVLVLCIMFDEAIRGDRLICRLIPFDYDIWIHQFSWMRMLLQITVYFCIGILLYRYFLSRKELLRCE